MNYLVKNVAKNVGSRSWSGTWKCVSVCGNAYQNVNASQSHQEWYIRENAVEIVRKKNAKLAKLRRQITKLEKAVRSLRQELRRSRGNSGQSSED